MDHTIHNKTYDASLIWSCATCCKLDCVYCFRTQKKTKKRHLLRKNLLHLFKHPRSGLKKLIRSSLLNIVKDRGNVKAQHKPNSINIPALLKTLDATNKTFNIVFTGHGEPFLISNIVDACEVLTKKHYVSFATNLVCKKCNDFCERINSSRVVYIHASLHIEELTKRNLLDLYIKNYHKFKEKKFPIYAYEIGHPSLLSKLIHYKTFFKNAGINLLFGHFNGTYKGKEYPQDYTKEEIEAFGFEKLELYRDSAKENVICNSGYNIFIVTESGNIQPCYRIKESKGNIYKNIEFKNTLRSCPAGFCFGPLKYRDMYLFEKAQEECAKVKNHLLDKNL